MAQSFVSEVFSLALQVFKLAQWEAIGRSLTLLFYTNRMYKLLDDYADH